jgi:hypothetical protein
MISISIRLLIIIYRQGTSRIPPYAARHVRVIDRSVTRWVDPTGRISPSSSRLELRVRPEIPEQPRIRTSFKSRLSFLSSSSLP